VLGGLDTLLALVLIIQSGLSTFMISTGLFSESPTTSTQSSEINTCLCVFCRYYAQDSELLSFTSLKQRDGFIVVLAFSLSVE
jgi:hypothetical protein